MTPDFTTKIKFTQTKVQIMCENMEKVYQLTNINEGTTVPTTTKKVSTRGVSHCVDVTNLGLVGHPRLLWKCCFAGKTGSAQKKSGILQPTG